MYFTMSLRYLGETQTNSKVQTFEIVQVQIIDHLFRMKLTLPRPGSIPGADNGPEFDRGMKIDADINHEDEYDGMDANFTYMKHDERCDPRKSISTCKFVQTYKDAQGKLIIRKMSIEVYEKVCNEGFQIVLVNGKPKDTYTISYSNLMKKKKAETFKLTVRSGEYTTYRKALESNLLINANLMVHDKSGLALLDKCKIVKCNMPKQFMQCAVKAKLYNPPTKGGRNQITRTGIAYGDITECSDGVNSATFFLDRDVFGSEPTVEMRTPDDADIFASGNLIYDSSRRKTLSSKRMHFERRNKFNVHIYTNTTHHNICKNDLIQAPSCPQARLLTCCLYASLLEKQPIVPAKAYCAYSIEISRMFNCDYNVKLYQYDPQPATIKIIGTLFNGKDALWSTIVAPTSPVEFVIPAVQRVLIEKSTKIKITYIYQDFVATNSKGCY